MIPSHVYNGLRVNVITSMYVKRKKKELIVRNGGMNVASESINNDTLQVKER